MPILTATGTCFQDAIEYLDARLTADPAVAHQTTLHLAHGLIHPDGPDGQAFAHAWVEDGDVIREAGLWDDGHRIWVHTARAAYDAEMRPTDVTRYTLREAHREFHRYGHYGPWKPEYLPFCGAALRPTYR